MDSFPASPVGASEAAHDAAVPPACVPVEATLLLRAIEALDVCMAILAGADLRHVYTNAAYRELTGGADPLDRSFMELFPGAIDAGLGPALMQVAHTGGPWRLAQLPVVAPGAAGTVWEVQAIRLAGGQDAAAVVLVWFKDVTRAVQVEAGLRQDLALLHNIVDTSTDVIFAKDAGGRMSYANPAALSLIGKPPEMVLGRTDAEFLDNQDAARSVMENDRRIMANAVGEELEETVPTPDGASRVWLSQKRPYVDAQGRVIGLLGISRDITLRKQAESAVRDAHDRLQSVLDSISDGVAILDRHWHYTYFSQTGATMLGIRPEDVLGKCLWELFPHAEHSVFGREYRIAMETGTARHFEDYYPEPLNMWVECHCYPSAIGLSVYFRNVTDRRCAQEAAAEAEQRINALLEASPVGLAYVASSGNVMVMNNEAMRIGGHAVAPASGAASRQAQGWYADGSERHGQPVGAAEWPTNQALAGKIVVDEVLEIEPLDRPGTRRTVLHRSVPVRAADGSIKGAVTAQMDITEQVANKAAADEADRRIRQLANTIPQMAWIAHADGAIHWFNERWYAYTGTTPSQVQGWGWLDIHDPDARARIGDTWERSRARGVAFEMTVPIRGKDGLYRPFYTLVEPLHNDSGEVVQWFGTNTDVSNIKKIEEELRLANQRKDEFLAMLAHELRNPLAPISSAAQLLRISKADANRIGLSCEIIERQVGHMTELIDDLLDVSRVTRGLIQLDKQPIDIKSVISLAVEQARPLIESREQTLSLHMGALHTMVMGDSVRLVQVLSNILGNAAKYTPRHGNISVSVETGPDVVGIAIADSGSGIDPKLLPHVFELFTQGRRTPDRQQGGLGLGLALVKSLVELHDGQVHAYSEGLGKGSTFSVTLPVCMTHDASQGSAEVADLEQHRSFAVMVVDDNPDAAVLLRELLDATGHEVTMFLEPGAALRYAREHPLDVCILDIGLPGMDGYELARQLRANPGTAQATLIALTGYGQPHDKVLSDAAGFDHHLVKPLPVGELEHIFAQIKAP
jgi:PAS domain S-box-containing protein